MRKDPPVSIPVDLRAVEATAQEATPGPWWVVDQAEPWGSARVVGEVRPGAEEWMIVAECDIGPTDQAVDPDAAHIAAADPPTVLAMVEALRIAREAIADTLGCGCCCYGKEHDDGCHEPIIDAALARLDALVDFTADPQEADRPPAATPEGLSEEDVALVTEVRRSLPDRELVPWGVYAQRRLVEIIDRLTGGPK